MGLIYKYQSHIYFGIMINMYEKYKYQSQGLSHLSKSPVFQDYLRKFADCYKRSNQSLSEAISVFKEMYPWMNSSKKRGFVNQLARQLSQDLAIDGEYKELIRDFNINYKTALEIEKDKMFETGITDKVMYVQSEWQKSLNMRKPQEINLNSKNVTNNQTNIQINHQQRLSDLPLEIQEALKTIAKHDTKQIEAKKNIDMFLEINPKDELISKGLDINDNGELISKDPVPQTLSQSLLGIDSRD